MSDPTIAVVIPSFKQPSLTIEAIESALRQRAFFDFRVVVVNDGCPYEETDRVCAGYARAYPKRVRYVRRRNGGLSAARNTGIDVALSAWPTVEAVQMLDSDDRLGPGSLEAAFAALRENPEAAWAYPNCRRIGFGNNYIAVTGPWVALELLATNYMNCAGMVRRSVFEQGLRYDEQMKTGYEDWEFWIQCVHAGMRGVHAPKVDFQYRQRGESMLGDVGRRHDQIFSYIRSKHADLYNPRTAFRLEQDEIPRFAIYLSDAKRIVLTSDPALPGRSLPTEELVPRLVRLLTHPQQERFPYRFVVTSEAFLEAARAGRFASSLFWLIQQRFARTESHFVGACVHTAFSRECLLEILPSNSFCDEPWRDLAMLMLSPHLLHECLMDTSSSWLRTAFKGRHGPTIEYTCLRSLQPGDPVSFKTDALERLVDLVEEHGPACREAPRVELNRGRTIYRQSGDASDVTKRLFDAGPLYPLALDRTRIQIGYVLPICEFGGAERVTMNHAREARRRGWIPHLFVIGSSTARLLGEFNDTFESICVVPDSELCSPDPLLGLLGTMDVIVNNNSAALNEVLGRLRAAGVKTFAQIHSVSIAPDMVPSGQPYEVVRYEHTLDGILVISEKLRRWCRSWGIPEAKLILVPNAPSFEVSDEAVATSLTERSERTEDTPLRILYLGRFDAEKGMDRLLALYRAAEAQNLPFEWKIVGGNVCGPDGRDKLDLRPIEKFMSPPVFTATGLARLYCWADVVIMLSRFEGVPLTVLEAQSFGCVVMSTDVGAVGELIESGRTGALFSNDLETPDLVSMMLSHLIELQADRPRVTSLARASAEMRRKASWTECFQPFARKVESMLPKKRTNQP
ncbi:MAG: glycosyltransferase [Planctomycetota bacterium]|nr:glycosyltransferase [Planctomycetota bacterium]